MANPAPKGPKPRMRSPMIYLGLGLAAVLLFSLTGPSAPPSKQVPYSELKQKIRDKAFAEVVLTDKAVTGIPPRKEKPAQKGAQEDKGFSALFVAPDAISSLRPAQDESLIKLLDETGTKYEVKVESTVFRDFILQWILPIAAMIFLWGLLMKRMGPGTEVMSFGKARSRLRAEADNKTTFADVAGQDEAKEELKEIIEFLTAPKRFTALGGKLPKGILLVGPPGTGKTLLARAVAGEAKAPFFNISGSDFVEMFVGVGAARVRDLFNQAKGKAPCIIFIDELDAIGKARGINPVGGHDEREQTLNQLLVEMDGFDTQGGVIIMAATNRPEILDPALLRAGRFDRHVMVGRPNVKERQEILELHAKTVKISSDVLMEKIAQRTPGMVGADLANIVNEAALLAARRDRKEVVMKDFEEAVDRVLTGLEKKSTVLSRKEKEIVAHHEAGHALVSAIRNSTDKVHKISIIPRGIGALGFTLQLPTEDRYLMTRGELLEKVDVLLGGRAAEIVVFNDVSTGASDDLSRATDIVRSMITRYGMGKTLGPATVEDERTPMMMDRGMISTGKNFSEQTAREIDEEVRNMMTTRMDSVIELLRSKLPVLQTVAQALLTKETLNSEEFLAIVA